MQLLYPSLLRTVQTAHIILMWVGYDAAARATTAHACKADHQNMCSVEGESALLSALLGCCADCRLDVRAHLAAAGSQVSDVNSGLHPVEDGFLHARPREQA